MLTYLRGLNRSSMSEPELLLYLTAWGIKCTLAPICVGTQNGGSHIQSAFTLSLCRDRQTALSMCRDLTHTHKQRNHSPSLLLTHTMLLLHTKQAGGGSREGDRLWLSGGPVKGALNQQLNSIPPLFLSAAASYYPSNFPSPLPGLLMHPIIGASHDYGNGSYCNPAFLQASRLWL